MKKNGVFIFVISHLVSEIFTIFVLCKLGTDDVIRCDSQPRSQGLSSYRLGRARRDPGWVWSGGPQNLGDNN